MLASLHVGVTCGLDRPCMVQCPEADKDQVTHTPSALQLHTCTLWLGAVQGLAVGRVSKTPRDDDADVIVM